jgi:hypothetical protein
MGSAFEQLLARDGKYEMARAFSALFQRFGSETVATAQRLRPDIEIDKSDAARAAAQPGWWVHRKWLEELYDLRSSVVHEGGHHAHRWGWQLSEHLVMAAFVFPLTVKLLLEAEGQNRFSMLGLQVVVRVRQFHKRQSRSQSLSGGGTG